MRRRDVLAARTDVHACILTYETVIDVKIIIVINIRLRPASPGVHI